MPLFHGQDIGAADIEREISVWDAVRFARFCNALAWASTWTAAQSVPAFTERVNVADNGIDAEWQGELAREAAASSLFLQTGLNVFQYKKREVTEETRGRLAAAMRSELAGAALEVETRTGKVLASYVLFTNLDLTVEQQNQLRDAILIGVDDGRIRVRVIAAGTLAAMVNDLPHLRLAFFDTSSFRTWSDSWEALQRISVFAQTPLIGRDDILTKLRGWIDDPEVRVIALSGTHMMGKTRIALEATRHRDAGFVEALDRQTLNADRLSRMETPNRSIIVLINDPDAATARETAEAALARPGVKVLLCVSTADAAPQLSFGLDARIQHISLEPLSRAASEELLRAAGGELDFSLHSWVVENAGGVPGVLLAAARVGARLRREGGSFLDQVAAEFEREASDRLSALDQTALRLLSLLSHMGVERDMQAEARTACTHFSVELHSVLDALERLEAAGFARLDGSYAEVVPPPLANRLAARLIRGRAEALTNCFRALAEPGRRRLLRRLVQLQGDEARRFWDELLDPGGSFARLDGILENSDLFRFAAAANGPRVGPMLLGVLQGLSVEQRRAIEGTQRRDIFYAVEEMLFRAPSSEIGLRCLALLAEAENERWSNNSSGVLKEAFFPLHSQMPLALPNRLAVLQELAQSEQSEAIGILAVEAAASALESHLSSMLRHSSSAVPLGQAPEMTYGDVWRYEGDCLELLITLSNDPRAAVKKRAGRALPRALQNFVAMGLHERGMPYLEIVLGRTLAGDRTFDVTELASAIGWCCHALRDGAHGGEERNAPIIAQLSDMLTRLRTADYPTRMRLWIGGWWLDLDNRASPGDDANQAIRALAAETCATPGLLTGEVVTWLFQEGRRSGEFWYGVGRCDQAGALRSVIADFGRDDARGRAMIAYLAGWSQHSPEEARAFFGEAVRNGASSRTTLLGALNVDLPDAGAARIAQLLRDGRLEANAMDALTAGQWVGDVSEAALVPVLELIAGQDLENGPQIPQIIDFRLHNKLLAAGPLADFTWRYLEARPVMSEHLGDYYCDQLAARLVALDADRAFALLGRSMRDERSGERWSPLTSRPQLSFWKALSKRDRRRALTTVLEAANAGSAARWTVMWNLPSLVEMGTDAALLLEFAARGEREALTACSAITGARGGFWQVAFGLVDIYPASRPLTNELEHRVEQMGQVIAGPYSDHFKRCLEDVQSARNLPAASAAVRAWLDDFAARLQRAHEEQRRREADDRINRG
ncbi:MAG TPA: hypothetical protein VJO12_17045 [Stellaceae bacterium]|nr:hypothetical protein [Stellaceae bacterium]